MYKNHPDVSYEVGPDGTEHTYVSGKLALRMFLVFALAYCLSYAFRSINAVIAEPLVRELSLSSAQLGLLASAYFFAFAVMQLPLGVMLDRYGPRRVESILILVGAIGAFAFASSHSFLGLWIGRALVGVGVSACLMSAVKAYSLYFKPHLQASMSSWMLVAGSLGALTVTTPVDAVLPFLGWRGVFAVMAGLCICASLALWFALPSLFKPQVTESISMMTGGYKVIFKHPHFLRVAPLAMVIQGGFMAFHGLWVGPWFTRVVGLSHAQAAQSLFWVSAFLMSGYLVLGFITHRVAKAGGDEQLVMLLGAGLSVLVLAWQVFQGEQSSLWGWLLHAVLISSCVMTYSICNKPFPKHLTGRSSSALNLTIFIGAFSIQWGIGLVIDVFISAGWSNADSMRGAMAVLLVLQVFAWLWFARPGRKLSHL